MANFRGLAAFLIRHPRHGLMLFKELNAHVLNILPRHAARLGASYFTVSSLSSALQFEDPSFHYCRRSLFLIHQSRWVIEEGFILFLYTYICSDASFLAISIGRQQAESEHRLHNAQLRSGRAIHFHPQFEAFQ